MKKYCPAVFIVSRPCDRVETGTIQQNRSSFCLHTSDRSESLKHTNALKALNQACSTRSPRLTCCPRHSVVLPVEKFEMKERPLILSLAKRRQNTTANLKNHEPFIYGDIHYITLLIHYVTSRLMYIQRNTEARSCNHCCSGKTISIKCSECVFVALGIHHTGYMRNIVICCLAVLKYFFTLPHKRGGF